MRYFYFPFLFGSALILQSAAVPAVLPDWLLDGFDLPLIIVLHISMTRGKVPGMMTGLVMGYLQDAMSGSVLGFNGVSKIVAGYMGGYLKGKFFIRSMAHRTASVAGAVFTALVAKVTVLALFAQPRPSLFSTQFLWSLTGNTLLCLVVHALLDRFETIFRIRAEEELSLGD